MAPTPLDRVDHALLDALRQHGRASYAELARQVGLSAPSVQDRVKRLEDRGFITGYAAVVPPAALGLGVTALVVGSGLFAIATWLSGSLSRAASALLFVGALLVIPAIGGVTGGLVPPALGYFAFLTAILAFPVGWIALGISALRVTGPGPAKLEGASA